MPLLELEVGRMVEPSLEARIRAARVVILSANKLTSQLLRSQLPPMASLSGCEDMVHARAALATKVFDLAIVDLDPGSSFDGLAIIEQLRQLADPKRSGLPVILLVANPTKDQVVRARKAGITQIVLKPFSTGTLQTHIKNALGEAAKTGQAAKVAPAKPADEAPPSDEPSDPDWMV